MLHIVISKTLQRKDRSKGSPFWTNFHRTRAPCGQRNPTVKETRPYKAIVQTMYFKVLLQQKPGQDLEFYLPANVLPSMQCPPMFTFRIQEDTNQPRGCLSHGWISPGYRSSTMARGKCVSLFCSASFTVSHQARSCVITGVH